jgi:hypothetical protein
MSDTDHAIDRPATPWKNEASMLALNAASQPAHVGVQTARSAIEAAAGNLATEVDYAEDAARRSGALNQSLFKDTAEQVHALLSLASTAQGGFQDLRECLSGLVDGVIRTNLLLAQQIFLVESPRAFAELQQRFIQEYFEAFEKGSAALIHAVGHPAKAL